MEIQLNNIRCFSEIKLRLEKTTTIFTGENGSGKSTIIEALYFCCFFKSNKTAKSSELIRFPHEYGNIHLQDTEEIEINFYKEKFGAKINEQEISLAEGLSQFDIILIDPETIEIITKGPSKRRDFVNKNISQFDREFITLQIKYNAIIRQKNKFLKEEQYDKDYHLILNQAADSLNEQLVNKKISYLSNLERLVNDIYLWINKGEDVIRIEYRQVELRVDKRIASERRTKLSVYGNHLDDIKLYINDLEVKRFASQGQKRLLSICLMLGQMQIMYELNNQYPLVIIDDIHAQLDFKRQIMLHNLICSKTKMIIATPTITNIAPQIINDPSVCEYKIDQLGQRTEKM